MHPKVHFAVMESHLYYGSFCEQNLQILYGVIQMCIVYIYTELQIDYINSRPLKSGEGN